VNREEIILNIPFLDIKSIEEAINKGIVSREEIEWWMDTTDYYDTKIKINEKEDE